MYGYPPFDVDPKLYGFRARNTIYDKIIKGFDPTIKETSVCHNFYISVAQFYFYRN